MKFKKTHPNVKPVKTLNLVLDIFKISLKQESWIYHVNFFKKILNRKKYWPLITTLLNGKKMPCITLVYHNNKFITKIKAKCELFNSYFLDQCTPLVNNIQLQTRFLTHIESVFTAEQVCNVIKTVDPSEAHWYGKISIWMLKLCRDLINKP